MAPVEVIPENEDSVRARLYAVMPKTLRWKFNVGDKVRISMGWLPFQIGYVGNRSEETFLVRAQIPTVPVTYRLADLSGEDIKDTFYSDELQFVVKPDDALFVVERILKTRRRGRQDRVFRQVARISAQVQLGGRPHRSCKNESFPSHSFIQFVRVLLSQQHGGTVRD